MKILWVGEDWARHGGEGDGARLVFRFAAVDEARLETPGRVTVPESTRVVRAGFDQHVLNRYVADAILRESPDVLVIEGVFGCTLDLPRVAKLLGVRVAMEMAHVPETAAFDVHTRAAWMAALRHTDVLLTETPGEEGPAWAASLDEAMRHVATLPILRREGGELSYARYEFCLRDHPLLARMQRQYVEHFAGCSAVLDLACGAGVFMGLLEERGWHAKGVERDPVIAEYARELGLDVETSDALAYLQAHPAAFDGIYCSHFVEHLPFEAMRLLLERLSGALKDGGVLLMVFPDPESIRAQLLGFWRDPEHVRFYHPELVQLVARSYGLTVDWTSLEVQPHPVGPFAEVPPAMPAPLALPGAAQVAEAAPLTWKSRWLARFGLVSGRRHAALAGQVEHLSQRVAELSAALTSQSEAVSVLTERTDSLWRINRTWAWNDNCAIRFRKRADQRA